MEQIQSFRIENKPGDQTITLPPDTDIFDVRYQSSTDRVILVGTVTVQNGEPGEWEPVSEPVPTTFLIAKTGDVLPSHSHSGMRKKYLGSCGGVVGRLHVWQIG